MFIKLKAVGVPLMFIKLKAVGVRRQGLSPVAGWERAVCQIQPGEEFSGWPAGRVMLAVKSKLHKKQMSA